MGLQQCLERADLADAKISTLHQTIEEITNLLAESSVASAGGGDSLSGAERAELEQLRAAASTKGGKEQTATGSTKEQLDSALKAKAELEVENEKLKYRITHLLRAIDPSNASAPSSSAPDLTLRKGGCLIGGRFQ